MSKLAEKLAERIMREFGASNVEPKIDRTYAGHWQRSAGAWSWSMWASFGLVGSVTTATKCLAAYRWETLDIMGTVEIFPYDKDGNYIH